MKSVLTLVLLVLTAGSGLAPTAALAQPGTVPVTAPIEWPEAAFAPDAELPFDPSVRTGTLDNGLRWFVRENHEPENRAALRLVVNAGSVLEDDDQRGLAHFLEHMAFNGTEHFEKQALVDYLESIGMQFGPEINAYTSFDETVYMLMVPTDDDEILETAFEVLSDWSRRVTLDPEEVVKERGVVLEEWRLGRGASQRVSDQHLPAILHGSRYAERLPIGLPEIIREADAPTLRRFYQDWYRPDLMAVVAVGDFDPDRIVALIESNFDEDWATPGAPVRERFDVAPHAETLVSIATDPELTTSSIGILVKKPVEKTSTVSEYRAAIVEGLFDGMFNQRLRELVERPDPPFLFGSLGGGGFTRAFDTVSLNASAPDGGIPRAIEAILTEARRVQQHGFTAGELQRQKARVQRALRAQLQERDNTRSESFAGRYVSHFLEDAAVPGIDFRYQLYARVLPKITLEEVNALVASRDVLVEENRVITVSAPQKEGVPVPTEEELRAVFDRVASLETEPYVDEVREGDLLPELPEPGRVVATERIEALDITKWTLSNGIEVLVKPTDFKEDLVAFTAFSPGGRSLGSLDLDRSLDMATMAVTAGGVGEFSSIELPKKLAGKRVEVSPYIGDYEEGVNGGGSPEDMETMLQLAHLYLTAPRRDDDAFGALRQRYQGFLVNRASNPATVYGDTLSVTLDDYHPWSTPLTAAQLDDVDLGRSMEFYRERFADVGDMTWIFVGNVDLDVLQPLVERYVGSLPSSGREESWRDPGIEMPEGPLHKVVHAGIDEKARTTLVMHGDFEWNRDNRTRFSALISALNIRLREVIREDMSGTYGVQVGGRPVLVPEPEWTLQISFGADPQRLDELVTEVVRVLEDVRANGFGPDYVEKVREQMRRSVEEGLERNEYWMSVVAFRARYGIDQLEQVDTLERIDAFDAEALDTAARDHLPVESMIRVDMLPVEAASSSAEEAGGD